MGVTSLNLLVAVLLTLSLDACREERPREVWGADTVTERVVSCYSGSQTILEQRTPIKINYSNGTSMVVYRTIVIGRSACR